MVSRLACPRKTASGTSMLPSPHLSQNERTYSRRSLNLAHFTCSVAAQETEEDLKFMLQMDLSRIADSIRDALLSEARWSGPCSAL